MFDSTSLYDQNTFYKAFGRDLSSAQQEVIIESPFITEKRMNVLLPIFIKMRRRNVKVIVNTRNPNEHEGDYYRQAINAVSAMQDLGIIVLYTRGHHRKLAIIDRKIVYEGSLNILSFSDSCEIMRKIVSETIAMQLCKFIAIDRYIRR
ncbi:MAG TPA: phospholipase D-like domain-containing protein [Candidatus Saccharimonadales bacterium]|nr:phospholipase D-like domain-containing protein [Candidatus Saccharimonadales bacterium]